MTYGENNTVARLAAALRSGRCTALDLAERALADAHADRYGAFTLVTVDIARRAARAADRELADGIDRGPLHGLPVAVKDNIDVAGLPTLAGAAATSRPLPTGDADAWRALRAAGAVLVGKTRLPELALDVLTPGAVNPRAPDRCCGGSSGGSAVAVAAGVVPLALGTDTGGSVRVPAALTGVVGLRPTLGAIGRAGVMPLSPSQDTVGVLANSVEDCLVGFAVATAAGPPAAPGPGRRWRVGVLDDLWRGAVDDRVAVAFEAACAGLAARGHDVRTCRFPLADAAPSLSYLTTVFEAARGIGGDGCFSVSAATGRRLAEGANVTEAEYHGGLAVAADLRADLIARLDGPEADLDAVALPTTATTALPVGALDAVVAGRRVPAAAAYSLFTTLASVTGLPAISVPCGVDSGLPVGLQLVGAPHTEVVLGAIASEVESWTRAVR